MKKNVGRVDQIVRIVAGLILLAVGILYPMSSVWAIVLIVIGTLLVVTGLFRFCPLYPLFKINTNK